MAQPGFLQRLRGKRSGSGQEKESTFKKLLDDITTLEVNTIIKHGMTSAPQPDDIEETLRQVFVDYIRGLRVINNRYGFDDTLKFDQSTTVKEFHDKLIRFKVSLKDDGTGNEVRLEERDFMKILRMLSFCDYIKSKSIPKKSRDNIIVKPYEKGLSDNVYELDMSDPAKYRLIMNVSDRVKIKRMYDLGTESIVMQTRFGLDGDVVTRIEEDFSKSPKDIVLRIHDKHVDLTVNYWKSLVTLVKDFVSELFK
jgi:hypothetical protein